MASQGAVASHRQPPPHRMLLFIALCSISVAMMLTAFIWWGAEWSRTPPGGFSVRGSHIYDPSGRDFIAHGVNISGPGWVWSRDPTRDADLIGEAGWRFNLVRINSCILAEPTCVGYAKVQTVTADAIVNAFTRRHIVVVFEAHDRTGGYFTDRDLDALAQWHRALARRYRDNPYVWFEVMNEPDANCSSCAGTYPNRIQWDVTHQTVVRAIRDDAAAPNIIVVEGTSWGQDAGTRDAEPVHDPESALLSSFPQDLLAFGGRHYGNIVASIHLYEQWNAGETRLADYLDRAIAVNNLPVIIGEYGSFNEQDTTSATQAMFAVTRPRGVGRIVWAWDGGDKNDLTTGDNPGGGWQINDREHPTNLTWLGRQVWDDNHAQGANGGRDAGATRSGSLPPLTPPVLGNAALWPPRSRPQGRRGMSLPASPPPGSR